MDTPDQLIGSNLQRLRGTMSQRDLGQRMKSRGWKWTHVTVGLVEKGDRPLRLAEAQDLCVLLRVDLSQLLAESSTAEVEMQLAALNSAFEAMRTGIARWFYEQGELREMRPRVHDEHLAKAADGWLAIRAEDQMETIRRSVAGEGLTNDRAHPQRAEQEGYPLVFSNRFEEGLFDGEHHQAP